MDKAELEVDEDDMDNKGLVDLDKFKETFSSLFGGGEPMQDEHNKCQGKQTKVRRADEASDESQKDEFIDSMKENFDKWNNIIDSMNTGDYDVFTEMFGGGEGNEENKIEIS